jgi:hypothetical protein
LPDRLRAVSWNQRFTACCHSVQAGAHDERGRETGGCQ